MTLKAKLRILLTEKQRDTLYYHFIKKEAEQRDKTKEKMGGDEGDTFFLANKADIALFDVSFDTAE